MAKNSFKPGPSRSKSKGGSWKGVVADLIGSGLAIGGTALGQPALGAAAGAGVSAGLRAIWGSGTYHVDRNTVLSGDANLTFKRTDSGVRITNREYVTMLQSGATLVNGATEFDNKSWIINPANSSLFPWLAGIATNKFVKYQYHGLVFEYIPTSGASVASANTALGTIAGAVNPDPNDEPWTSLTELLHAENAISSVPSNSIVWPVECANRDQVTRARFVANYAPDGEIDPRLVSPGLFQVATSGQQAAEVELGQLWVTYDIELFDPILEGGTIGVEGIYNPLGTPSRILSNGLSPAVLTVNQYYVPDGNVLYFKAPFEGMFLMQFHSLGSQENITIASNRPTTFQKSPVDSIYQASSSTQLTSWMMKADSGTEIVLGGVVSATFELRVYMMPFPYGSQYWPLLFGPRTKTRAFRAMPRRALPSQSDDEPLEDELVPCFSRPSSPAVSTASSRRSFVKV